MGGYPLPGRLPRPAHAHCHRSSYALKFTAAFTYGDGEASPARTGLQPILQIVLTKMNTGTGIGTFQRCSLLG